MAAQIDESPEAPLVDVTDLRISSDSADLVHPLDLTIRPGERVGLIGESGSGKSLTALSLIGLLPDELTRSGSISFRGGAADILSAPERELCKLRGRRISMVFQEPMTALNPLMKVGKQVGEVLRHHRTLASRREITATVQDLLHSVHLPNPEQTAQAYPHQLSGGQRQRVMLAMAFANDPDLLICDEPTTALDVTVQRQVLELLDEAVRERGTSLLFVSHDLAVVAGTCDRILVMEHGRIVEAGPVVEVLSDPRHDYTKKLLAASRLEAPSQEPGGHRSGESLIRIENLHRRFRSRRRTVHALNDVSLSVAEGERLGIVGESGSGKTTLLKILAGLDQPSSGTAEVCGVDVTRTGRRALRPLRERLQIVFQDPMGSLDPRMSVQQIVEEPLIGQSEAPKASRRRELVAESLEAVGIPAEAMWRFPHQFSGGQRQRISIARALITDPDVLVADEPVSALDVSVQAQVLDLMQRLVDERGLTLVMVSHDLSVVRYLCDRVIVMRHGEIVESGETNRIYDSPQNDYTQALLEATPSLDRVLASRRDV